MRKCAEVLIKIWRNLEESFRKLCGNFDSRKRRVIFFLQWCFGNGSFYLASNFYRMFFRFTRNEIFVTLVVLYVSPSNSKLKQFWGISGIILKPLIHERAEWFANQMCVCVVGLRTCAAPSANSSHTIHCELKFVSFLGQHKENWMRRVSFPCTGCPLLASGLWKIN